MVCPLRGFQPLWLLVPGVACLAGGCPSPRENPGGVSEFVASLTDTSPSDCDVEPLADAGADIEASDPDGDGFAYVYLDATASEPAGNVVVYAWADNGKALAAGEHILVRLPIGNHPLTLRIEDPCGRESTDTVNVVIKPAAN